jgi:DNA-binding MarR family transcriptional regulator
MISYTKQSSLAIALYRDLAMPQRPLPRGSRRSPHAELANQLNSTAIHLLRRISRDDSADGLTAARASALSVLAFGGPQRLGELARREGVTPPTMTRIVDGMVRDGMVRRVPSPTDRRAMILTATTRGRALIERGRSRRIQRLARELSSLEECDLHVLEEAVRVLLRLEQTQGGEP